MENLIESIRAALVPEATPETRQVGAAACRTILSALESVPGQPLAAATVVQPNAANIASVVATLRGVPADALLDLAIAKLRAALPAGTEVPQVQRIKFQMIPESKLATLGGRTP